MSKTLFMVLMGCKPSGRHTEQHDIFFGVADSINGLVPAMKSSWPDAGKMHVDVWRPVTRVDGYRVEVCPRAEIGEESGELKLFFVNLGGYKDNDFEEYHYKQLIVAKDIDEASRNAKQSPFYHQHISPHIDDKYGIDVDDVYPVEDIMDESSRQQFGIVLTAAADGNTVEDKLHIGYLKFSDLEKI
ncbi:DUF1543 domain-containing protein [Sphingobacterium wenxiniae]|uniref:DUF1543 domain-containing protein n=1 Tax=Sphingobacterium wenxiniae TaxID=683125 RepID=A0A1I6NSD5_9SPHI|nr:DUF1543 domain-containing protein [Sphingobacterium wenxiniae]SFS30791.1 protein of unknown function [Sphingobacterium wenxiniae]